MASLEEKNSKEMDHFHFSTYKGKPWTAGGITGHRDKPVFCKVMKEVHSDKENLCSEFVYLLVGLFYFFFPFITRILDMYLVQQL